MRTPTLHPLAADYLERLEHAGAASRSASEPHPGIGAGESCTGGTGLKTVCTGGMSAPATVLLIVALVALLLAPIATAVFLARRARASQAR